MDPTGWASRYWTSHPRCHVRCCLLLTLHSLTCLQAIVRLSAALQSCQPHTPFTTSIRHLPNRPRPYLIPPIKDVESRRPPPVPIHIVPQCLDRRPYDARRRLMLVRVICHHDQPITCPPKRSSLQYIHDGIVGRVEQNHDACARYGMRHLQDHVRLGTGGTPEYGCYGCALN